MPTEAPIEEEEGQPLHTHEGYAEDSQAFLEGKGLSDRLAKVVIMYLDLSVKAETSAKKLGMSENGFYEDVQR